MNGVLVHCVCPACAPTYSLCAVLVEGADFNDPVWNNYSEACKDFITKLLQQDPAKRMTAADARTHPWIVGL